MSVAAQLSGSGAVPPAGLGHRLPAQPVQLGVRGVRALRLAEPQRGADPHQLIHRGNRRREVALACSAEAISRYLVRPGRTVLIQEPRFHILGNGRRIVRPNVVKVDERGPFEAWQRPGRGDHHACSGGQRGRDQRSGDLLGIDSGVDVIEHDALPAGQSLRKYFQAFPGRSHPSA